MTFFGAEFVLDRRHRQPRDLHRVHLVIVRLVFVMGQGHRRFLTTNKNTAISFSLQTVLLGGEADGSELGRRRLFLKLLEQLYIFVRAERHVEVGVRV